MFSQIKACFLKMIELFSLLVIFFIIVGMKIILRDGNFIEVDRYRIERENVYFERNAKRYMLPKTFVDLLSTEKLAEFEGKSFSVLLPKYPLTDEGISLNDLLSNTKDNKTAKNRKEIKLRLETYKETNPFFMELPKLDNKDEDILEKIKRKGLFFKIDVPLKDKK